MDATGALASARLAVGMVPVILSAMVQEHERAAGGWQAEWAAIPDLFSYTASAVEHVRLALSSLQVNTARMNANLALTRGLLMAEALTMALAPHLGKSEAHRLVQALCEHVVQAGVDLRQAALSETRVRAHLSIAEIEHALDPGNYLGSTDALIERALAAYREMKSRQAMPGLGSSEE